MVEADVRRHGEAGHRRQLGNRSLDVQGRLQGLLGAGKQHHDLVADGLDQSALRGLGTGLHRSDATADRGQGGGIARPFIEPRTAADIREQYRALRRLVQQFPVHVHPDPSRHRRAATRTAAGATPRMQGILAPATPILNMNLERAGRGSKGESAHASGERRKATRTDCRWGWMRPGGRPKNKTPEDRDLPGFRRQGRLSLAETEGFEPSIQVLARMLP
ncbi:protein of unknown function [Cupriavidus neocaledonicus]|uniref:Uncharacterized protein n=1 Tax=Cupriavidus neocaledonicus TaxID=1040979 RepID=A0A375H5N6_9BURK|nr:protein of unknown function [Cupriavidus neocaledonicus]